MSILALPNELLYQTFMYLNAQDLANTSQVCRKFHDIADNDQLWEPLFNFPFPQLVLTNHDISLSWKEKVSRLMSPYGRMIQDIASIMSLNMTIFLKKLFKKNNVLSWQVDSRNDFQLTLKNKITIPKFPLCFFTTDKKIQGYFTRWEFRINPKVDVRFLFIKVGECGIQWGYRRTFFVHSFKRTLLKRN